MQPGNLLRSFSNLLSAVCVPRGSPVLVLPVPFAHCALSRGGLLLELLVLGLDSCRARSLVLLLLRSHYLAARSGGVPHFLFASVGVQLLPFPLPHDAPVVQETRWGALLTCLVPGGGEGRVQPVVAGEHEDFMRVMNDRPDVLLGHGQGL